MTRFIIILLTIVSFSCYSKGGRLIITNVSVSGISLGDKSDKLVKKLGQPIRIERIEPEIDVEPYEKYYYGKSYFEITSGVVTGFEINTEAFVLDQGKIKVGDSIEKVKKAFPNGLLFDNNQAKVRIGTSDDYLLFVFANNKVYSFSLYRDE